VTPLRLVARIALRQIWHRKGLSAIAALGVALGVVALVMMNSIMKGFQERFKEQLIGAAAHVFIEEERVDNRPSLLRQWISGPLAERVSHDTVGDEKRRIAHPFGLVRSLRELDGVNYACGILIGQLEASVGSRTFELGVRGIDPVEQDRCTPIARYVKFGRWVDFVNATDSILIGSKLAEEFSLRVGDRFRLRLPDGTSRSVRITAIFETGLFSLDRQTAYLHRVRAQSMLGLEVPINRIDVQVREPFAADQMALRLRRLTGYKAVSWIERNAGQLSVFNLQNLIVSIQIVAILTVGGFGILAIQIMIVLQKTHDISIMRSIGLRRRDILGIFLAQGILLALVGGLVGDLIGWRLIEYLDSLVDKSQAYTKEAVLYMYKDPPSFFYGLLFAVLVGSASSLIPAWRGSRVEPVEVLRGRVT
jgi:lipoprotein-releasing system permease protein